jgi:hypothetical protein
MSQSVGDGKRRRTRSMRKTREEPGLDFKDAKDLQEDYDLLIKAISHQDIESFSDIIKSSDMKYFLVHNDLDYSLFRECVRCQSKEFIQ